MKVEFSTSASQLRHIFREAQGHVSDTPKNRDLLLEVANDPVARLKSDRYGNIWAARVLDDGRQVWVQFRENVIVNAGVNVHSREFHQRTGLKKP